MLQPQRPQMIRGLRVVGAPTIVAGQVDVVPAERPDVAKDIFRHVGPREAQRLDGAGEIDCVPKDDRRNDEVTPWIEAFVNARQWIEERVKS